MFGFGKSSDDRETVPLEDLKAPTETHDELRLDLPGNPREITWDDGTKTYRD
jgi:hypothetical protein